METVECAILFLHHNNDLMTSRHLNVLQEHNLKFPVFPIYSGKHAKAHLPNAIDTKSTFKEAWSNCDQICCDWFKIRSVNAKRYVYLEYDALCLAPVNKIYRNVWNDCDAACARIVTPENDLYWPEFENIPKLPLNTIPYALSLNPFNGILLSHDALQTLTNNLNQYPDVFCELRTGTLLNYMGATIKEVSQEFQECNTCDPESNKLKLNALCHPVKTVGGLISMGIPLQEYKNKTINKLLI